MPKRGVELYIDRTFSLAEIAACDVTRILTVPPPGSNRATLVTAWQWRALPGTPWNAPDGGGGVGLAYLEGFDDIASLPSSSATPWPALISADGSLGSSLAGYNRYPWGESVYSSDGWLEENAAIYFGKNASTGPLTGGTRRLWLRTYYLVLPV